MKEGRYRLEGNMFVIEGKKYVIRERKEEKRSNPKPKRFLIQCSPFQYISSLFPPQANAVIWAITTTYSGNTANRPPYIGFFGMRKSNFFLKQTVAFGISFLDALL